MKKGLNYERNQYCLDFMSDIIEENDSISLRVEDNNYPSIWYMSNGLNEYSVIGVSKLRGNIKLLLKLKDGIIIKFMSINAKSVMLNGVADLTNIVDILLKMIDEKQLTIFDLGLGIVINKPYICIVNLKPNNL